MTKCDGFTILFMNHEFQFKVKCADDSIIYFFM